LRWLYFWLTLTTLLAASSLLNTVKAQPSWLKEGGYALYSLNIFCPQGHGEALIRVDVVKVGVDNFIINTSVKQVKPESLIELLKPLEGQQVIKYGSLEGQFYGAVGSNITDLMSSLVEEGFTVTRDSITVSAGTYSCFKIGGRHEKLTVVLWLQEDTGWPVKVYVATEDREILYELVETTLQIPKLHTPSPQPSLSPTMGLVTVFAIAVTPALVALVALIIKRRFFG